MAFSPAVSAQVNIRGKVQDALHLLKGQDGLPSKSKGSDNVGVEALLDVVLSDIEEGFEDTSACIPHRSANLRVWPCRSDGGECGFHAVVGVGFDWEWRSLKAKFHDGVWETARIYTGRMSYLPSVCFDALHECI